VRYQEFISKNGGEVANVERWGRRRLAYAIKKKSAGFYVQLLHKSPSDIVPKLDQTFKLDEDIIRYLTVVVDKNMLKAREGVKKHRRRRPSKGEPADESTRRADIATASVSEKNHDDR
jgi:small subunit ribosomal protein S6